MKRLFSIWAILLTALLGLCCVYLFTPGTVPEGQPDVLSMNASSLERFAAEFDAAADQIRVVAILDPAKSDELRDASMVQTLLTAFEKSKMKAFVIWQPEQARDWTAPSTQTLAHVKDPRVRQCWDRNRLVSQSLGNQRVYIFSKGALWPKPVSKTQLTAGYATKSLRTDFKKALQFLYSVMDPNDLPNGLTLDSDDLSPSSKPAVPSVPTVPSVPPAPAVRQNPLPPAGHPGSPDSAHRAI